MTINPPQGPTMKIIGYTLLTPAGAPIGKIHATEAEALHFAHPGNTVIAVYAS